MNPTPPVLTTDRLVLRLGAAADVEAIIRYFRENREHLAPSRPRMGPEFYTESFWLAQIGAHRAEFREDCSLRLFVFDRAAPGEVVGNVNYTQFVRGPAQYCVLGYGLAREREGRGMMREALEASIRYVFDELNLRRIEANYVPRNERSGRLLRRLGFVVEGYARDYLLLNGRWEDHIRTSLTNARWHPAP